MNAGAEEHNSKFHHWHEGQDAGAAVHFNEPKLIWASHQKGKPHLILRQVWDGGDIVANSHPATQSCEVRFQIEAPTPRCTPDLPQPPPVRLKSLKRSILQ